MTSDYRDDIRAMADELRAIADLSPAAAFAALGRWANRVSEEAAELRLRRIRAKIAKDVVDATGTQTSAAEVLGVRQPVVSRILSDSPSRSRS